MHFKAVFHFTNLHCTGRTRENSLNLSGSLPSPQMLSNLTPCFFQVAASAQHGSGLYQALEHRAQQLADLPKTLQCISSIYLYVPIYLQTFLCLPCENAVLLAQAETIISVNMGKRVQWTTSITRTKYFPESEVFQDNIGDASGGSHRSTQCLVHSLKAKISLCTLNKSQISGQLNKLEMKEACHVTVCTPEQSTEELLNSSEVNTGT